jgi:hypothetical protein
MLRRYALCLCVAALAGLMVGCQGDSDARKFGKVTGKVTSKGTPIKGDNISVSFAPASGEAGVTIPLKPDGSYEGEAVLGANKVSISAYVPLESVGIQQKYTSAETSGLTADVQAGKANNFDFEVGQ